MSLPTIAIRAPWWELCYNGTKTVEGRKRTVLNKLCPYIDHPSPSDVEGRTVIFKLDEDRTGGWWIGLILMGVVVFSVYARIVQTALIAAGCILYECFRPREFKAMIVKVRSYATLEAYIDGCGWQNVLPWWTVQSREDALEVYRQFYTDKEIHECGGMVALSFVKV